MELFETLRELAKSGSLSSILSVAQLCIHRLSPELQTDLMTKQSIGEIQKAFMSVLAEMRERQVTFINELRSTDDLKVRKLVDEFVARQNGFQASSQTEFLAKLDAIKVADVERFKDYRELVKSIAEIRERLMGTGIGEAGEVITLLDLKKMCPWDRFSEAKSKGGGTDIVATVNDKGVMCGQISISVKYDARWNDSFIEQLAKNVDQDGSRWGVLITRAFPREALNPHFYVTSDGRGRNVLVVKPELAPLAYFVARQIAVYWKELEDVLVTQKEKGEHEERIREAIDQWLTGPEFAAVSQSLLDAQRELTEMGLVTAVSRNIFSNELRESMTTVPRCSPM